MPVLTSPDHPVIDLTGEEDDNSNAIPTVSELLTELDELMPALRFPQYEDCLLAAGFRHVYRFTNTPAIRTALDNLGIPIGVVEEMIDQADMMMRRAAKSDSTVKSEDGARYKF